MAARESEAMAAVVDVPRDPIFEGWAREERFLWLPERGMGRLVVDHLPYDASYFASYAERAATPMGWAITAVRADLVRRFAGDAEVIDVGIGCGEFISIRGGNTFGYDVNPEGVRWLQERGLFRDPYERPFTAVTLWDVIEHLAEPQLLLAQVRRWAIMTLPIVPGDGPPPRDWRHFKPREHAWYWRHDGLVRWMAEHGFELRHSSDMEVRLGRLDIGQYVFERRGPTG